MPNIKSAKKRVKVISTKNLKNKSIRNNLRSTLKKANTAIETNANSQEAVRLAIKKIDQAVAKGIMHKNTAARRKSQLMRRLNRAS